MLILTILTIKYFKILKKKSLKIFKNRKNTRAPFFDNSAQFVTTTGRWQSQKNEGGRRRHSVNNKMRGEERGPGDKKNCERIRRKRTDLLSIARSALWRLAAIRLESRRSKHLRFLENAVRKKPNKLNY